MSTGTKAIREALDYLENNPSADEAQDARRRARRELEAIRKAARTLDTLTGIYAFHGVAETADEIRAAKALLKAIAKEEP